MWDFLLQNDPLQMPVTVSRFQAENASLKGSPYYIAHCDVRTVTPHPISRSSGLSWGTKWPITPEGLVASNNVQMVQYSAKHGPTEATFSVAIENQSSRIMKV
ncbi:hypothetical protein AMECASPLE_036143 [Ameca splendens]|uniref:Uncharacterized protein n=1 Tax=Ameca splendens TaxID=208324 RepID=A0ABV0YIZ5_9TELE